MTIATCHANADVFCDNCLSLGIPTPTILKGNDYRRRVIAHGWSYGIGGHLVMASTTVTLCLDCADEH